MACTSVSQLDYEKLLANDQIYISSEANRLSEEDLILLSYPTLQNFENTILTNNFFELKKALFHLELNKAEKLGLGLLESLEKNNIYYYEVARIISRIYNLSYAELDKREKLINRIMILDWDSDFITQHKVLCTLIVKADSLHSKNENLFAMSVLCYALHLIEKSTFDHYKSEAEILHTLGSIQLNEIIPGSINAAVSNLENASEIYHSIGLVSQSNLSKINLANALSAQGNDLAMIEVINKIDEQNRKRSPLEKYYIAINKGFTEYLNSNHEQAIYYYRTGLSEIEEDCSRFKFDLSYYISESFLELNKLDSARHYLGLAKNFSNCGFYHENLVNFYTSDIEAKLISKESDISLNKKIDFLIKRRLSAEKIFPNKQEYHLGDFYVQNTFEILLLIYDTLNQKSIPSNLKILIPELFRETKKRELKRFLYESSKNDSSSVGISKIQNKINKSLYETSDMTDLDYSNIHYSWLYKHYSDFQTYREIEKSIPQTQSPPLNTTNQIIEFLSYKNNTAYYIWNGKDFFLDILQSEKLKKENEKLESIIHSKDEALIQADKISKSLNFDLLNEDMELVISTDNLTSNFPFDLLLPDNLPWSINPNYTIKKRELLDAKKSLIFSFSDSMTTQSHHEKEVTELVYGMEECNSINKLLTGSSIVSGIDFSKESILNMKPVDVLHISTHAYSNTQRRQDCYMLSRKENTMVSPIYSVEIKDSEIKAKFVCLGSCDTGLGGYISGEGVYSLSQSFLSSGSETVLKTLWKVDDQATKEFMVKFYERWLTGISVLDAQYEAKQYLRDSTEFSHPYYWAGFALEGNPHLYLSN